jgi:hypothetical protein
MRTWAKRGPASEGAEPNDAAGAAQAVTGTAPMRAGYGPNRGRSRRRPVPTRRSWLHPLGPVQRTPYLDAPAGGRRAGKSYPTESTTKADCRQR